LRWEAAYATGYQIQVSTDGSSWTTIHTVSGGDGGVDDLAVSGSGRHLRVHGTQRATAWGYSLFELEVYGSTGPTPEPTPVPTATPTPTPSGTVVEITPPAADVTASTNDGNLPANTVDNSLATRWSANGDGQWIRFDLGSPRSLSHVAIAFYSGNVRRSRFDLQVSSDGTSWTNALTNVESGGTTTAEESFGLPGVSARFVRYVGHGNSVNLWNSLTEVSLFAVP